MNNKGFWAKLNKPFFVLAPMANVTDFAFRQIVSQCGRPDVYFTEFLSCDGIVYDKTKFDKKLYFEKSESPIVVQFFGSKPKNFYKCAQLAVKIGYDGIDINMGCPDKSVEKQGGGAVLIKNPTLAREIIKATQEGSGGLPVSVKTRLGYNKIEIDTWISSLLEMDIAALTIHGRTRKEMSKVPANWEAIGRVSDINKQMKKETLIIGNGDVKNLDEAHQKAKDYNLDGIMVGRGIFDNPWFFNAQKHLFHTPQEHINLMLEHLNNFENLWGKSRNFDTLKRFFKIYVAGWEGAKELRTKLMATKSGQEVKNIVDFYIKDFMV